MGNGEESSLLDLCCAVSTRRISRFRDLCGWVGVTGVGGVEGWGAAEGVRTATADVISDGVIMRGAVGSGRVDAGAVVLDRSGVSSGVGSWAMLVLTGTDNVIDLDSFPLVLSMARLGTSR